MNRKRTSLWILVGCTILLSGCEKDNTPKTAGEVTITSERVLEGQTYTINGFLFAQGKVINYNPETSTKKPDLVVLAAGDAQEVVAILDMPGNVQQKLLMGLAGEFGDWTSAEEFFNTYTQIPDSLTYSFWINPTLKNQVWVIKTLEGKYGKIVIKNVATYIAQTTRYAEVTFKWAYQPDGSTLFD